MKCAHLDDLFISHSYKYFNMFVITSLLFFYDSVAGVVHELNVFILRKESCTCFAFLSMQIFTQWFDVSKIEL